MPKYLYWPVAGAAVFWREAHSLERAKAALPKLRADWPDVEIERVMLVDAIPNARRYWRWRDGNWSVQGHYDPRPDDLARWADVSDEQEACIAPHCACSEGWPKCRVEHP